jgi:hypothetical protein
MSSTLSPGSGLGSGVPLESTLGLADGSGEIVELGSVGVGSADVDGVLDALGAADGPGEPLGVPLSSGWASPCPLGEESGLATAEPLISLAPAA